MGSKEKKTQQLGMNPSTAQNRLRKDILYKYVALAGEAMCYRCGKFIEIDDFSIEHKEPWLDSGDAVELFFDLENISFSHLDCNVAAKRPPPLAACGTYSAYCRGCRCTECKKASAGYKKERYDPAYRSARYHKNEK